MSVAGQCETPAAPAAESAVHALNQQYIDAARKHDVSWFDEHMTDGAIIVHAPWELGDGRSGVSRYIDTYAWIDCRWKVVSAQITWLLAASKPAEPLVLEIRSYNLKPGTRAAFHELVVDEAAPMLERWNVDLVDHGPSSHDDVSYFVLRAYPSLEQRQRSHDEFYGSREWIEGPRDRILALIENYTTVVLPLPSTVIDGLRRTTAR